MTRDYTFFFSPNSVRIHVFDGYADQHHGKTLCGKEYLDPTFVGDFYVTLDSFLSGQHNLIDMKACSGCRGAIVSEHADEIIGLIRQAWTS